MKNTGVVRIIMEQKHNTTRIEDCNGNKYEMKIDNNPSYSTHVILNIKLFYFVNKIS